MFTRRSLLGTALAVPTIIPMFSRQSEAAIQPAILQNEIWQRPGVHTFADCLRSELLKGAVARHCIGAHRTADTAKHRLQARYTMELAYDGQPRGINEEEFAHIIAQELAGDLARHREIFNHSHRIALVALDGCLLIDPMTFQPAVGFHIDWNGIDLNETTTEDFISGRTSGRGSKVERLPTVNG